MNTRQRRTLTRYVRTVADDLGLKDWNVITSKTPADEGDAAKTVITFGQKRAEVMFGPTFWTSTTDEQRATIIHELLHCHLASADAVISTNLKASGLLTEAQCALLFEAYSLQREYAVDGIAEAIAGRFPALVW